MEAYIQKSDTRILSGLSKFQTKFADYKAKPLEKLDGKEAFWEKLEIAVDPQGRKCFSRKGGNAGLSGSTPEEGRILYRQCWQYVHQADSLIIVKRSN